ncbi:hypothetical protein Fmac_009302 [Flemingia macrophylla]|uniref:valine--tRNA ligase n=1 Tax=Flemingia macrophylla TaxID=520843 RepID=A0ABD1MZV5_9FABA
MDKRRSKAVTEAFVRLFKQNLIYRDLRLVNWDCVLRTAISDIEVCKACSQLFQLMYQYFLCNVIACCIQVDYIDIKERSLLKVSGYDKPVEFGVLTKFAYPLEGNIGEIVVTTTRIETMLGDTAIVVHPDDDRYRHFHGKHAIHPFNGRKLPIICDAIIVDPKFGTGAVKVGKRHSLEFINIFTDDRKINSDGGSDFLGMPRFKAREAVTKALKNKGLYRGSENNEMHLGVCSRSNDVVEPMIKPQWYVNCKDLAKQALQTDVDEENIRLEIVPKQYLADWKSLAAIADQSGKPQ